MPVLEVFGAEALRDTVITFRDTMRRHAAGINLLNVYPVPDGDTGTNMSRTLDAVVTELESADHALEPTCEAISYGSLMGARGNSGVILSQILRGLVTTLRTTSPGSATKVAAALKAASVASYEAVLKPIEGTILTVVRETADAAQRAANDGATLAAMLHVARAAGRKALANTPEQLPVLKDAGVVDAGGAGFMLLMDAALHIVDGEPLPEPSELSGPTSEQLDAVAHRVSTSGEVDVSELRYEVMFLLNIDDSKSKTFMQAWGEIGDSIVVVGGDGLYNCHVHTNDIGAAIEAPIELGGKPFKIRVTDLFEEMAEEHAHREAQLGVTQMDAAHKHGSAVSALPAVECAVVAICSGAGLEDLFAQMGVQGVVTGGQTLNPSTAELLDAVEHMNSSQVIILPNNKNIIPVANQVNALTKKEVRVVPTCSMPEALAALVSYDPEADVDSNCEAMSIAAKSVATGEVTQAVRDTNTDAGAVKNGDWIGLVRGDGVVAIGSTMVQAATSLLSQLMTNKGELLTVITGNLATARATEEVVAYMAEHYADVEVEVHAGGQPLYPFLFGVE
ncbi:MAG: DAK2 domain-containing protein [Actinobacteria bacterium]|nr:MAG: DAK2 domain-containing protein [Actinomycetota bacterium]